MMSSLRNILFPFSYLGCDCCNHNVALEALYEDEQVERQTRKEKMKDLVASLKKRMNKNTTQSHQSTTRKTCGWRLRQLYEKARCMGTGKSFERLRQQAPSTTSGQADPVRSAVQQLLTTMFKEIVENDHNLARQLKPTTQCFLVHLLSDLNSNGPFLSRYTHLPRQTFGMDFDLGLSFVSSWLQTSLTKIKASYSEGEMNLQMPFCVLETTQAAANAGARALQRHYPEEKVGIATLDLEALKRERLIASAQHTFDFLRVSRQGFVCRKKLLAWAEGSGDDSSAYALRSAVLAVIEWQETSEHAGAQSEEDEGDADEMDVADSQANEREEQWSKWADPSVKHDSGVASRKASGCSAAGMLGSNDALAVGEEKLLRCHTL